MDGESNKIGGEPPHGALLFVLAYLPIFELLAMSQVCRSFRDAFNDNVLPWLNTIVVEKQLSSRLSDNALVKITSKANGRITRLDLEDCVNITDDGLLGVVTRNPLIIKLHIPNCTVLTPEGVIRAVKTLNQHNGSLRSLKIKGIQNINEQHLATLHTLLQVEEASNQLEHTTLYHEYKRKTQTRDATNDQCSIIDVEICPRCKKGGMIFNCPRLTCNRRRRRRRPIFIAFDRWGTCRGCYDCIPRCEECGNCVQYGEVCQAACGDIVCNVCWVRLVPKCSSCNKPYCSRHAGELNKFSESSSSFVCDACHPDSF